MWGSRTLIWLTVGIAVGFIHAVVQVWLTLDARLPGCVDVDFHQVRIELIGPPAYSRAASPEQQSAKFQARLLDRLDSTGCQVSAGARVQLTWFQPPDLLPGDVWTVTLRLRQPWSYRNPGGFDYERWLFGKRLQGTGYVREGQLSGRSGSSSDRPAFADFVVTHSPEHAGVILALTRGDASAIDSAQWDWFRATGTIHLMVVSGLHVGLVTGACFLAFRLLLRGLPMLVSYERLAGMLALLAAAGFVLVTGSGVPAQRAWLMAAMLMLSLLAGRRVSRLAVFLAAMAMVLLLDPLAVHQSGFYLSFGAVGVLLGVSSLRQTRQSDAVQLLATQAVLFGFLTPALALAQASVAGAGALSNLLAVPALGLILPLLLIAMICWWWFPGAAELLLLVAGLLLDALMTLIESAANLPAVPVGAGTWWLSLLAFAAALTLCARVSMLWWPALLLSWLAWLVPEARSVPHGEFTLTALDVGQGSAIVIDTASHRLLFDTGPGYPSGFDLGAAAVVPSLLRTGAGHLDVLVLSHQDLDHTGGYQSVLEALSVARIFASFSSFERCQAGVSWWWDDVQFEFLNLPAGARASDNDRSCVLRISARQTAALLSGDISHRVERRLVRAGALAADLVMAPHHGSNSSSSAAWIAAIEPELVLISAPRRSRYGHPHPAVLERYQQADSRIAVTGYQGALHWQSWAPDLLLSSRTAAGPYWVNPPLTVSARAHQDDGSSAVAD